MPNEPTNPRPIQQHPTFTKEATEENRKKIKEEKRKELSLFARTAQTHRGEIIPPPEAAKAEAEKKEKEVKDVFSEEEFGNPQDLPAFLYPSSEEQAQELGKKTASRLLLWILFPISVLVVMAAAASIAIFVFGLAAAVAATIAAVAGVGTLIVEGIGLGIALAVAKFRGVAKEKIPVGEKQEKQEKREEPAWRKRSKEISVPVKQPKTYEEILKEAKEQCSKDWSKRAWNEVSINNQTLEQFIKTENIHIGSNGLIVEEDIDKLGSAWQKHLFQNFAEADQKKMVEHFWINTGQFGYFHMLQIALIKIAQAQGVSIPDVSRKINVFLGNDKLIHIKEELGVISRTLPLKGDQREEVKFIRGAGVNPLMKATSESILFLDEKSVPKCSIKSITLTYPASKSEDVGEMERLFKEHAVRKEMQTFLDNVYKETKDFLKLPQPPKIQPSVLVH